MVLVEWDDILSQINPNEHHLTGLVVMGLQELRQKLLVAPLKLSVWMGRFSRISCNEFSKVKFKHIMKYFVNIFKKKY